MTEMDRQPFGEMLFALGEAYGESISAARMEIYFRALDDLSLEEIRRAANVHARASKFFPKPVELREAIEGKAEDQAEIAWQAVQKLVKRYGYWHDIDALPIPWPNYQTKRAALELYGGWRALCENLPASGPEMLGTAKLFKATFTAFSRQDARESAALQPSKAEARAKLVDLKAELDKRGLPTGAL